MGKRLLCFLSIIAMSASLAFAGSETKIKEGQWEITIKLEMQGMKADIPPATFSRCLSTKDAVPIDPATADQCKILDTKIAGNTVTWKMKCTEQAGSMEGNGKIIYHGDTFDGTMTLSLNDPEAGKMNMLQRISGKRTGNCK